MVDDRPGPSVGDAAEMIEELGFDPWSCESLKLVAETYQGQTAISGFEIKGCREWLEALRSAHDRSTRSVTQAPVLASGIPYDHISVI